MFVKFFRLVFQGNVQNDRDFQSTFVLEKIEQNNAIGVNDSSSQILIKFAGSLPTIRLKISAVLFLEFFAHWKDSYNNETSLKKPWCEI